MVYISGSNIYHFDVSILFWVLSKLIVSLGASPGEIINLQIDKFHIAGTLVYNAHCQLKQMLYINRQNN